MPVELPSKPGMAVSEGSPGVDEGAVLEAWKDSVLGRLPEELAKRILERSRVVNLEAGGVICRDFEGQFPFLIVDGLVRYYLQDSRGRQVSIIYRGPADTANLVTGAVSDPLDLKLRRSWSAESGMHHAWEAIRDTTILRLSGSDLLAASRHDLDSAWALVNHLMTCLTLAQVELAGDILLPVQSRLARHLLNLAERRGDRLVVYSSNQELADATGSVRDVTSRVLGTFSRSGIIAREGRGLVLLEPAELHDIAIGRTQDLSRS